MKKLVTYFRTVQNWVNFAYLLVHNSKQQKRLNQKNFKNILKVKAVQNTVDLKIIWKVRQFYIFTVFAVFDFP